MDVQRLGHARPTVRRGLSDRNGSWKIICTSRRCARSAAPRRRWTSTSPKRTRPLSGRSSPTTVRASVDLPQPDSPTSADHLARIDVQVDVVQRRARRRSAQRWTRYPALQAFDGEHAQVSRSAAMCATARSDAPSTRSGGSPPRRQRLQRRALARAARLGQRAAGANGQPARRRTAAGDAGQRPESGFPAPRRGLARRRAARGVRVVGVPTRRAVGACSTIRPAYTTAIVSAMSRDRARSWLMMIRPCRARRAAVAAGR